ncbi:MAG: hypothetical protein DWQ19_11340 [Crenarchaeota archaeon]|nr:MAG: hypothetical protein DWQ19_11340 [Thermoproteota archaeon]
MYLFIARDDECTEVDGCGDPIWSDEIPFWSHNKKALRKAIRERYKGKSVYFTDSEYNSVTDEWGDVIGWIRQIKKEVV